MKRILLFETRTITSLVVLLMSLPVWGNDGDSFTEETVEGVMLTYTIISEAEKTCMVGEKYYWEEPTARANKVHKVNGSQPSGDITIPEVANGYAVIRIETYAFENAAITSVVIPNSVKSIGIGAFMSCVDLKSVRLSNQLKKIEYATFNNCANLTSIDIPEGVTSIGDYAFNDCKQLKEAIIPSSAVQIGRYVFAAAGFISMPKLPEGLTTIPYGIFQSCPLTSVEIPQNITSIDGCAFNGCPISEVEIPASVTHIGVAAFAGCKKLSDIAIPDNVTDIDFNAFYGCSNLKTVMLSNNLNSLSEGIFGECTSLESIVIPNGVKAIGKSAFGGCSSLSSITIPETIEEIGYQAFHGCSSLKQLFVPKNVVCINIKEGCPLLYGCNSLTSIIVDQDNPVYDSRNNCNAIIETASNKIIVGCTTTTIPEGITSIGTYALSGFQNLTSMTLPQSLKNIEGGAFNWLGLKEINIPENVTFIAPYAFSCCKQLETVKSYIKEPYEISDKAFFESSSAATLYVPLGTIEKYKTTKGWTVFSSMRENTEPDTNIVYRLFIEEGKVWKLGARMSNPIKFIEYYYFDGDTTIDGKTCKQMMCQRYVTPDYEDYEVVMQYPLLRSCGEWYEEDKKVYAYDSIDNQFRMMYDFSIEANDTLQINNQLFVIGPKQTGGIKGFKGIYRDVMTLAGGESFYNITWLEGVGSIDGPTSNVYYGEEYHAMALMSCTVGDEVIYLDDEYEDGATPEEVNAKKHRFDFTHTIKTQPRTPTRREAESSIYGEYTKWQLGINLNPLEDAYTVRITDGVGKVVYEKAINAGNIVALNIDISTYLEGCYIVTVENSHESFTGEFEIQTTGIEEKNLTPAFSHSEGAIFNLQGQRLSSLQKGLNIVNGRKIFVK